MQASRSVVLSYFCPAIAFFVLDPAGSPYKSAAWVLTGSAVKSVM